MPEIVLWIVAALPLAVGIGLIAVGLRLFHIEEQGRRRAIRDAPDTSLLSAERKRDAK